MGTIQGLDSIPKEIQRRFAPLFGDLLPRWTGANEAIMILVGKTAA